MGIGGANDCEEVPFAKHFETALQVTREVYGIVSLAEAIARLREPGQRALAAAAILWLSYERPSFSRETIEDLYGFLEGEGASRDKASVRSIALVKFLVGTGLLYLVDSESEDFPGLMKQLVGGVDQVTEPNETFSIENLDNRDDFVAFSAVTAAAIIKMENSHLLASRNEYERAFLELTGGWKCVFQVDCEAWFVLPSTRCAPMQWEVQDILDELRTDSCRDKVEDWSGLIEALDSLARHLDWGDMVEFQRTGDRRVLPTDLIVYLELIRTFMSGQMSLQQAFKEVERSKDASHGRRLELDFFQGLWGQLAPETRQCLKQMESDLYDASKRGGRTMAAANELRLAFEHELNEIVFRHKGAGRSLSVRDMAILLEKAGPADSTRDLQALRVKDRLATSALSKEDREYLCGELPKFLHELAEVRRKPEHRLPAAKLRDSIGDLRRQALGIGQPGHLQRLLHLKKKMLAEG